VLNCAFRELQKPLVGTLGDVDGRIVPVALPPALNAAATSADRRTPADFLGRAIFFVGSLEICEIKVRSVHLG
jgi:hypothetical protein